MDSLDTSNWDPIDYSSLFEDITPTDHYWGNQSAIADINASLTATLQNRECNADIDASLTATLQDIECAEKECPRKRGRNDSCSRIGTKACRERLRREKLNERFAELSSILEPGRPSRTDKLAIIGDAIRVLNQLKTESQEYKEANEKLLEEIKTLKAEKNELREEKQLLKSDKEKLEQQLKVMPVSHPGYMPAHPAAYHAGANKMPVFPNYGLVPMWQYLPPSARDTSCDHELRPPAA